MSKFRKLLLQNILVFGFFLIVALVVTFPAIRFFRSDFIGDGGDGVEYASYFYLLNKQISNGEEPFGWTDLYRYPYGFDFELGSDARAFVAIGSVLLPLMGDVVSYNSLIILALTLNGFFTWLFFKELTKSSLLGIVAGVIFGFSYQIILRAAGHANLVQVYAIPLIALYTYRTFKNKDYSWKNIGMGAFGVLLLALSSLDYLLYFTAGVLFSLPLVLYFYYPYIKKIKSGDLKRLGTRSVIVFVLLVVVIKIIFPSHFNKTGAEYKLTAYEVERHIWTPRPSYFSYLLPNTYLMPLVWQPFFDVSKVRIQPSIENAVFVGNVEVVLLLLSFVILPKSRGKKFLVGITVLIFVVSLYTSWPYAFKRIFYKDGLWPFNLIFDWQRYFVFFYFFATILIVSLLKHLRLKSVAVICFLVILLLSERVSFKFFHVPASVVRGFKYQEAVKQMEGNAVLDIPVNWEIISYNMNPHFYGKPIVSGYFNWPAFTRLNDKALFDEKFEPFDCRDSYSFPNKYGEDWGGMVLGNLRELSIDIIVRHKDAFYPNCELVLQNAEILNSEYFEMVYTDEQADIYKVKKIDK